MGEHMSTKIASHSRCTTTQPSLEGDLAQQNFSERSYRPASSPVESSVTTEKHSPLLDNQTTAAILKILKQERGKSHP